MVLFLGSIIKSSTTIFSTDNDFEISNTPKLYQNNPNPFNASTEIKYFIPDTKVNASINVYNFEGRQLMSYSISHYGSSYIVIQAGEFDAGIYIYNLLVDGIEIDSKRMILTK